MKLPPATEQPLNRAERLAQLGSSRHQLLEKLINGKNVYHIQRTDTKVDVGHWLGKRRVWICMLDDEMLLLAVGKRSFVDRFSFDELNESQYNHVTGEIVLAPIEITKVQTLRIPPLAALEILAFFSKH